MHIIKSPFNSFSNKNIIMLFLFLVFSISTFNMSSNDVRNFCEIANSTPDPEKSGKLEFFDAHNICESIVRNFGDSKLNEYERCMCDYSPFGRDTSMEDCGSQTVNWQGACSATIGSAAAYEVLSVNHQRDGDRFQGSASFICYNGSWLFQQGNCLEMPKKCEAGQVAEWSVTSPSWASSGGADEVRYDVKPNCRVEMPEAISGAVIERTMDGTTPLLDDWMDRYDVNASVARMRCFNGQWSPLSSSECIYIPKNCPPIEYTTAKGCSFDLEQTDHNTLFKSQSPTSPFNSAGEVRAFCWDGNWEIRTESCTLSCDNEFAAYDWESIPLTAQRCSFTAKTETDFSEPKTAPNGVITISNENDRMEGALRLRCSDGDWLAESEFCRPKDCNANIPPTSWSVGGVTCQHNGFIGRISHNAPIQLPNRLADKIGAKQYSCQFGNIVESPSQMTCSEAGSGASDNLCFTDQGGTFDHPYYNVPAWNGVEARCRYIEADNYVHCLTSDFDGANVCSTPKGGNNSTYSELTTSSCVMPLQNTSGSDFNGASSVIGNELKTFRCTGGSWNETNTTCVFGFKQGGFFTAPARPADPVLRDMETCSGRTESYNWLSEAGRVYTFDYSIPETPWGGRVSLFSEVEALASDTRCSTSYVSVGEAVCQADGDYRMSLSQHCRGEDLEPEPWTVEIGCATHIDGSDVEIGLAPTGVCNKPLVVSNEPNNVREISVIYPLIDDVPFSQWASSRCSGDICAWDYEVLEYTDECMICGKNGGINNTNSQCQDYENSFQDRIEVGLKSSSLFYEQYCDSRLRITFTDGAKTETLNVRATAYAERPCVGDACDLDISSEPTCGVAHRTTSNTVGMSDMCGIGNAESVNNSLPSTTTWDCVSGNATASCFAYKTASCGVSNGATVGVLSNLSVTLCNSGSAQQFEDQGGNYVWRCVNGTTSANCSAEKSSSCGTANGTTRSVVPNTQTQLCSNGTASGVNSGSQFYDWTCTSGASVSNCSSYRVSQCGAADGGVYSGLNSTSSELCEIGERQNFRTSGSEYLWSCVNGSSSNDCSANMTPSCGSATEIFHNNMPTVNLCNNGVASTISDNGLDYSWSCNIGTFSESCTADKAASCGVAENQTYSNLTSASSELCGVGNSDSFSTVGNKYIWSCENGSSSSVCEAFIQSECGLRDGGTFNSLDLSSSDLCGVGSPQDFDDNASGFDWVCASGDSVSFCSANKNANCGSANDGTFSSLSGASGSLCSIGSSSNFVEINNFYEWNCTSGSDTSSCRANRAPTCGNANNQVFSVLLNSSDQLCDQGSSVSFDSTSDSSRFLWNCENGSETVSCKAFKQNSCGVRNNNTHGSLDESSTGLCSNGDVEDFNKSGTTYSWTCANGPSRLSCQAYETAICDTNNIGECEVGVFNEFESSIGSSVAIWNCRNAGGEISSSCSLNKAPATDNGQCGEEVNECISGTFSDVADDAVLFNWSCGVNEAQTHYQIGSVRQSCFKLKGSCGNSAYSNHNSLNGSSDGLCDDGNVIDFEQSGTVYTWGCDVFGEVTSCEAYQNAQCGTNNNNTFPILDAGSPSNCFLGSVDGFSLNGSRYTWNCDNGNNNFTSCEAYLSPECGSANGAIVFSLTPSNNELCDNGSTYINFNSNPTNYTWGCSNVNNETISCSANKIVPANCGVAYERFYDDLFVTSSGLCSDGSPANFGGDNLRFTWECVTSTDSELCFAYKNPKCGSSQGQVFSNLFVNSSNLCNNSNPSTFTTTTSLFRWTCENEGVSTNCSAYREPSCGSSENGTSSAFPTSNLCSIGGDNNRRIENGDYAWECENGGATVNCSSYTVAVCGASHQSTSPLLNSSATTLCLNGDSLDFNETTGQFEWSCQNGTSVVDCFAYKDAACGASQGQNYTTLSSLSNELCNSGSSNNFSINESTFTWGCDNGESSSSCSAFRNPSCGQYSNNYYESLSASDPEICGVGQIGGGITVSSDLLSWTCENGNNDISCSAYRLAECGSRNGGSHVSLSSVSSGLCSVGNVEAFNLGGTTYSWGCRNNDNVISCEAYQTPTCNNSVFGGCNAGDFNGYTSDLNADTSTWNCINDDNVLSSQCSREKLPPTDTGVCSIYLNNCDSGTVSNINQTGTTYTWSCGANLNGTNTRKPSYRSDCVFDKLTCGSSAGKNFNSLSASSQNLCADSGTTVSGFGLSGTTYTWNCDKLGATVACEAYRNPVCGSSNGGTFSSLNSSSNNLCSFGNVVGFSSGQQYTWGCRNANNVTVSCSAYPHATCGSAANNTHGSLTSGSSSLCGIGSSSGFSVNSNQTTYSWNCNSGTNTQSCTAYRTAACDNTTFGGCTRGDFGGYSSTLNSIVSTWSCLSDGGASQNCSRTKLPPTDTGVCGTLRDECLSGTLSGLSDTGSLYRWRCGTNITGTNTVQRSVRVNCDAETPTCGTANNNTYSSLTSGSPNLCGASSTVSGFSTSGTTYSWNCNRSGGSTSCSAYRTATCNNSTFGGCGRGTFNGYTSSNNDLIATWTCVNPNGILSGSCSREKTDSSADGICSTTSVNSCTRGAYGALSNTSTLFRWYCGTDANGTATVKPSTRKVCTLPQPSCGTRQGNTYASLTSSSSNLCASGSGVSGFGLSGTTYSWNCNRSGQSTSCNAYRTPQCGTLSTTTSQRCSVGTFGSFTSALSATTATWSCVNSGGVSTSCSGEKAAPTDMGSCGTNRNTCNSGTYSAFSDTATNYRWYCGANIAGTHFVSPSTRSTCTAPMPACGTRTGNYTTATTSGMSNLCSSGSVVSFSSSNAGTLFTWNCSLSGGTSSQCSATRSASCGSANGTILSSAPSTAQRCSVGNASGVSTSSTSYTWSCTGSGSNASCSATRAASCNLNSFYGCSVGSPTSQNTTDPTNAEWNCVNGTSTSPRCVKPKTTGIAGSCGSLNGQALSSAPSGSGLCSTSYGNTSVSSSGSGWTWRCNGSPLTSTRRAGSLSPTCSASAQPATCGSRSGNNYSDDTTPSMSNLCGSGSSLTSGSFSSLNGNTRFTWTCSNAISTSSQCSATRNAVCGNLNGTITSTTPSNNCSRGSSGIASLSGGVYSWTCSGSGNDASCSAFDAARCNPTSFYSCGIGSVTNVDEDDEINASWNCVNGPSTSPRCVRRKNSGTPGACGSANGGFFSNPPNTNLCSTPWGASAVSTNLSTYTWSCDGSPLTSTNMVGSSAPCSADRSMSCTTCHTYGPGWEVFEATNACYRPLGQGAEWRPCPD